MKRLFLFTVAVVALGFAATAPPRPSRCRVEAIYTPRFGSEFGSILVRLLPDCPSNGVARVRLGNYGGPGSKATGPTETLSKSRPVIIWQTQPFYRSVLWEAQSGMQYPVPIQGR